MTWEFIQPWMYSLLFGSMALLIIGNNYYALLTEKSPSLTLFIGAVFLAIAIGVAPIENSFYFVWVALLIDPSVYLLSRRK